LKLDLSSYFKILSLNTLMSSQKTIVTSALLYANGPVHIGHLAGCYIPADIYARYLRSKGQDVIFVTGSDEHGVPITIKAQKEGLTPQQVVDKYHAQIKDTFESFGISPDIYSRTSNPVHYETSQEFFLNLYNKGAFTEEITEQYFDPIAQKFLADRYIIGTCPICANDKAYGDQCEKCGSTLSPEELINPHSALSGEKPIKKATKNWYLPLDKHQPFLNAYIDKHKEWKANVLGQCKSWLKEGLKPRAMTRDLEWGVPVPLPNNEGKVLYVWFDAPIGYISMTKELFEKHNDAEYQTKHNVGFLNKEDERLKNASWKDYWQNKETCLVHFIGKDNIVFHCLIFPAMLEAYGDFVLADNVPANEFLNLEGDKISTSRNWAVWAHEYLQDFPDKQDALRYFLTANAPETKDNNFTWKDFQTANNSELVGILGNFVNRTLVLTEKYFNNTVPPFTKNTVFEDRIKKLEDDISQTEQNIIQALDKFEFRLGIQTFMDLARLGNKFLAETEPWKLAKTDMLSVETILHVSLQLTNQLAKWMKIFMPFSAQKLQDMLAVSSYHLAVTKDNNQLNTENWSLKTGHCLGKSSLLFEKIEDDAIAAQIAKLEKSKEVVPQIVIEVKKELAEAKPLVTFDEFSKMDIRIGTILEAEKVAKADKLLKLKIDTGLDQRTVVSGIAEHFNPEDIIGKQVSILINLAPRKIKGIESQGMILMAQDTAGKLHFVKPDGLINDGSSVA
jgi:methionyl-tRNA synthetase